MKWHDARVEPAMRAVSNMVKDRILYGPLYYHEAVAGVKESAYWEHEKYGHVGRIVDYPFYASAGEIEKELDSDD